MQNRDIEKCILMASSEDNFILEFLNGCLSKKAAKCIYLRNSRLHIFYISYISYFDVMLKRNEFLWILLSDGFEEKCKLTELALNFIQKHYIS